MDNSVKSKHLHIISFDHPYPPVYGGVIDVYYKIKALAEVGVRIHLHVYGKEENTPKELSIYCEEIHYYPRKNLWISFCSGLPMIVKSRRSNKLIDRLLQDNYPVLFEGLHTTYCLRRTRFLNRHIAVRMHNVEQDYYAGLAKAEKCLWKKLYYRIEAKRLARYDKILAKATSIFTISKEDTTYYQNMYPQKTIYISAFHENKEVIKANSSKDFALFHGNLQVSENTNAILFLLQVFKDLDYKLVIAGRYLSTELENRIGQMPHVSYIELTDNEVIRNLFKEAHIHVLYTAQNTGIKLKLINALYSGKHVIANDQMIDETGLDTLCIRANSIEGFKKKIIEVAAIPLSKIDFEKRQQMLKDFDVQENAKKIAKRMF